MNINDKKVIRYPNGNRWNPETRTCLFPDGKMIQTDDEGFIQILEPGMFGLRPIWLHVANVTSDQV